MLVGEIEISGSKLDSIIPGTGLVGAIKRLGSDILAGVSNREVSGGEQAIRGQAIGERENLGASDWGVIENNNTVRNE